MMSIWIICFATSQSLLYCVFLSPFYYYTIFYWVVTLWILNSRTDTWQIYSSRAGNIGDLCASIHRILPLHFLLPLPLYLSPLPSVCLLLVGRRGVVVCGCWAAELWLVRRLWKRGCSAPMVGGGGGGWCITVRSCGAEEDYVQA